MKSTLSNLMHGIRRTVCCFALAQCVISIALAQTRDEMKLADATAVLQDLTNRSEQALPAELLRRARGLLIVPNTVRGGLLLGGRRGRGALVVRTPTGEWSTPAFVTLTGGSIGWQIGAESADVVLVITSEAATTQLTRGRLTLGGDVAVTAGYSNEQAADAVQWNADVYAFAIGRGLFAGASFEGNRVALDYGRNQDYYGATTAALAALDASTPPAAREFLAQLRALEGAAPALPGRPSVPDSGSLSAEEATIYPLGP
jgi:lipid-binding SYLF domain-containing protein